MIEDEYDRDNCISTFQPEVSRINVHIIYK